MCWLKSSLESKINPRCFSAGADCILLILKVKGLSYQVYVRRKLLQIVWQD